MESNIENLPVRLESKLKTVLKLKRPLDYLTKCKEFAEDLMQYDLNTLIETRPDIRNGHWTNEREAILKEVTLQNDTHKFPKLEVDESFLCSEWAFGFATQFTNFGYPIMDKFRLTDITLSKNVRITLDAEFIGSHGALNAKIPLDSGFHFKDLEFLQQVVKVQKELLTNYEKEVQEFKNLTSIVLDNLELK